MTRVLFFSKTTILHINFKTLINWFLWLWGLLKLQFSTEKYFQHELTHVLDSTIWSFQYLHSYSWYLNYFPVLTYKLLCDIRSLSVAMSVLNLSGDEAPECPLCMDPLELDDYNFYPCSCGYQVGATIENGKWVINLSRRFVGSVGTESGQKAMGCVQRADLPTLKTRQTSSPSRQRRWLKSRCFYPRVD